MPSDSYPLSLHDALPISWIFEPTGYLSARSCHGLVSTCLSPSEMRRAVGSTPSTIASTVSPTLRSFDGCFTRLLHDISLTWIRSEEHTSELQSHSDLVCRPIATLFPYTTLFRSPGSSSPRDTCRRGRATGWSRPA